MRKSSISTLILSAVLGLALLFGMAPATAEESESPATESATDHPKVQIVTNHGSMTLELRPDMTPKTVENFLAYVEAGFYDGTIFHRVIKGFMIQGGGMNMKMEEKATHAPIKNEADNGLANERGTIAMARTRDPHSATAQFFINTVHNDFLDWFSPGQSKHPVFGKVIEGMDVVNAINSTPTDANDRPIEPVRMNKITILQG